MLIHLLCPPSVYFIFSSLIFLLAALYSVLMILCYTTSYDNFFRFLVEKAEQTKKATIISAEGDAQAAILLAKAFGDAGEGLVELRRIEAAEDIAYQLSRSRQVSYLPGGQNLLLNVPTPGN